MTIFCKICGHRIRSERAENAEAHVLEQMSTHLGQHPKQAAALAEDLMGLSQMLATYLLITRYVRIPPDEAGLLESFQRNEQELVSIFGVEPQPQD